MFDRYGNPSGNNPEYLSPAFNRESQNRPSKEVYSVSSLNFAIRDLLEGQFFYCLVDGEVSNAAFPASGHIYFNLKDEGAVIKAVIWRSQAVMFRALIANGQKVRVTGKISVYAPRGEYQLIINRVEEAGKGDLYLQFEALKKKLAQEGLFNNEHKKLIPKHPKQIGIVTSSTAAALQDVLNVFAGHRPDIPLKLYATKVQGEDAANEITSAIAKANAENSCDLLLVIRGGGSIEDLWAFNEEIVARAIYASHIPIITGVGHETDTTIADYVADLRAPTPSMAAKYSSLSRDELFQYLGEFEERMMNIMYRRIERVKTQYMALVHRLQLREPRLQLQHFQQIQAGLKDRLQALVSARVVNVKFEVEKLEHRLARISLEKTFNHRLEVLDQLSKRLSTAMQQKQKDLTEQFVANVEKLTLLSPLNILLRGYSMTTMESGAVVKSITQVNKGDALSVKVADGTLAVEVIDVK